MGIMAGGAETTKEDVFVYGEEVQREIEKALVKLGYGISPYEVRSNARRVLEGMVWNCVKDYV